MASRVLLPRPQQMLLPVTAPILPEYPGNMTYQQSNLNMDLAQDPNVAEKNHRKVLRNRVNAQLSREKKRRYVEDLEDRVKVLEVKNKHLERKVVQLEATNATLQTMLEQQQPQQLTSTSTSDFAPTEFDFLADLSNEESVMEVLLSSSSSSSDSSSTPEVELPEFLSDDDSSASSSLSTASAEVLSASAVAPLNGDPTFWNPQILSDDSSMESDGSSGLHSRSNSNSDVDSLDYFLSGSEDEHFSPLQQQEEEQTSPQSPLAPLQQQPPAPQAFADEGGMVLDEGIAALNPPPGFHQQQQPLQSPQLQQQQRVREPPQLQDMEGGFAAPADDSSGGGGGFALQQSQQQPPQGNHFLPFPGDQQLQSLNGIAGQLQSSLEGIPGQLQSSVGGIPGQLLDVDVQAPQVPLQQPQHLRDLTNPLINSLENLAGLTEQLASTTPSLLQLAESGGTRDDQVQQPDGQDFQVPQASTDSGGRDRLVQTTQRFVEHVQSLTEVSQHLIHSPLGNGFGEQQARENVQPTVVDQARDSAPHMAQLLQASGLPASGSLFTQGHVDAGARSVPETFQVSVQRAERALLSLRLLGEGSGEHLSAPGITQAGQQNLQALIKSQTQDQNHDGFGNEDCLISSATPYFYQYVEDAEEVQWTQPLPLLKFRPGALQIEPLSRSERGTSLLKKKQIQLLASNFHDQLSSLLQFVLQLAQTAGLSHQKFQAASLFSDGQHQRMLFSPVGFSPSSPSLLAF